MKVMARFGHASCACAPFDAHAIPSASASAPICFIEFSFWLSEPDKQVPCRCANLWNRDPLASAATSHARALQPGRGQAAAVSVESAADRGAAQALENLEMAENRVANAAARWCRPTTPMTSDAGPH